MSDGDFRSTEQSVTVEKAGTVTIEHSSQGKLKDVDVDAGEELTRQGRSGREFFVLVSGRVRVERDGRTLSELHPGDFLGEIALIDGGPRTATATTESDAQLLVISQSDFGVLLERFPEIQSTVLRALTERIRRLEPDGLP
jgi:CRP-like cAMP-binding protein